MKLKRRIESRTLAHESADLAQIGKTEQQACSSLSDAQETTDWLLQLILGEIFSRSSHFHSA